MFSIIDRFGITNSFRNDERKSILTNILRRRWKMKRVFLLTSSFQLIKTICSNVSWVICWEKNGSVFCSFIFTFFFCSFIFLSGSLNVGVDIYLSFFVCIRVLNKTLIRACIWTKRGIDFFLHNKHNLYWRKIQHTFSVQSIKWYISCLFFNLHVRNGKIEPTLNVSLL